MTITHQCRTFGQLLVRSLENSRKQLGHVPVLGLVKVRVDRQCGVAPSAVTDSPRHLREGYAGREQRGHHEVAKRMEMDLSVEADGLPNWRKLRLVESGRHGLEPLASRENR